VEYHPIFLTGLCFTYLEQPDSAIYYFRRAIRDKPKFEDSYFELAKLFAIRGESDKALEYCDRVLQMNPSSPDAYFYKALIYYYSDNERYALKKRRNQRSLGTTCA